MPVTWAYGVTTVPERFGTYLPKTLASLANAGFDQPRLFVDGREPAQVYLPQTLRGDTVRTAANWFLALWELYFRHPLCDRYAIFQDDLLAVRGLRSYLSRAWPGKGYLNLYTFAGNVEIVKSRRGWHESNQNGRGAVALCFDRDSLETILLSRHMFIRTPDPHRGWRCVDGGIVQTFIHARKKEYVHNPSLVQHIGLESSMGNYPPHAQSPIFPGEDYEADRDP